jgi:hypothetical protein
MYAQNDSIQFKKVELDFNVFTNPKSNLTKSGYARNSGYQLKYILYPLSHRNTQFGFGFGYERLNTSKVDSFSLHEKWIPIIGVVKFSSKNDQLFFVKFEMGSALVLNSEKRLDDGTSRSNSRPDIGVPILISGSLGITFVQRPRYNIGLELGYSYKQYGYKNVVEYNSNAIVLGIFAALP